MKTRFDERSQSYVKTTNIFPFLAMLYTIIIVSSSTLVYKIVEIHGFLITAGALLTPVWNFLSDVIAEVYGYKVSKRLIWFGLICEGVYSLLCTSLIHLPSPSYWHKQQSYIDVLSGLPRIFTGSIVGTMFGTFINAYLVTKWKILMNGKHFWLRGLAANVIGQLAFSASTGLIDLIGIIPAIDIIKVILSTYLIKISIIPIVTIPSALLASYLKKAEGIDVYDHKATFNPFNLTLANYKE